jgi:hypothetical protein
MTVQTPLLPEAAARARADATATQPLHPDFSANRLVYIYGNWVSPDESRPA